MWPWVVDGRVVGALDPPRALALARFTDVFAVGAGKVRFVPRLTDAASRTAAVASVARALADEGRLSAWRDERYAVGANPDGAPLFLLERAAARYFGIRTFAAHVNGTTRRNGSTAMWIARRSPHKAIDPDCSTTWSGAGSPPARTSRRPSRRKRGRKPDCRPPSHTLHVSWARSRSAARNPTDCNSKPSSSTISTCRTIPCPQTRTARSRRSAWSHPTRRRSSPRTSPVRKSSPPTRAW